MSNEIENLDGIVNFINACNDLADGKFILADIKISKILKAISDSPDIYSLLGKSMINYNFDKEFEKAIVKDEQGMERFILPVDNENLIPLVFCLLVEIDSKKIDLNNFIKLQFPLANNQNDEYLLFAKTIIIPFRNAIAEIFGVEVDTERDEEKYIYTNILDERIKQRFMQSEEELEEQDDAEYYEEDELTDSQIVDALVDAQQKNEDEEVALLFDRMLRITRILDDKMLLIKNTKKKSNIKFILSALFEAYNTRNLKVIVALVMALNSFAGNERYLKGEINELNIICYDFFYE